MAAYVEAAIVHRGRRPGLAWVPPQHSRGFRLWAEDSERVIGAQRRGDLRFVEVRREILAGIDELVGLELVLLVVERAVPSTHGDELGVGPALDDLAVLEDQDLVRAADRRQPVCDDERGPAPPQRLQPALAEGLACAVEPRGASAQAEDAVI